MGVNYKVRTDFDLDKGSYLGMGLCAIERSYTKVGVGHLWKLYFKQFKNYAHLWNLNIVLTRTLDADADADAVADRRRRQRLGDNISLQGT